MGNLLHASKNDLSGKKRVIHEVGIGDALGVDGTAAGSFPKQSQERSDEVGDHAVNIQTDQHDDVLI
jgi:hypothetical protein